MATIVKDNLKNQLYVLVGVGFGSARTTIPTAITSTVSQSDRQIVAVANAQGEISWIPALQLTVVSVDGQTCDEILNG